jgi:hypothetical protein
MFKSFQEYVVQQLPAQYLTDGSFEKLTVVEVGCSNSKEDELFPLAHAEPFVAFPRIFIN